ncbi:molybdenum cofactor sulfurase [Impatiens glandulifera]|uniref:molybdenum cofactor sulfurase n=1 Tax=Impatiens glandulifera TaxID=253017 RepID=UPI001FB153DD|nr:molybdenum cofactor sulfurase [Impatiens glandulifera]
MQATSSCFNEHAPAPPCLHGCCAMPFIGSHDPQDKNQSTSSYSNSNSKTKTATTTTSICRHTFAATTASSFFRDQLFTNHESLPSFHDSFTQFTSTYPNYLDSSPVDEIRSREYSHLTFSNHVCLDYIGIGLFSYSQLEKHLQQTVAAASSSTIQPPPRRLDCPLFGVSHKLVNFKSELLHGGQASELECAIKRRIMDFLKISSKDYSIVLTTNRSLAFKLVSESYPFRSSKKLLTAYDYQSEAVESMVRTSETRGAKVMSAEFKWPRLRINSERLRNMIVNKSRNKNKNRKKKNRGLFVFPIQSRVTGGNYSYQWMSLAQENGWHILLDACALGPKDMGSFGLSIIKPDFFICSFYKVFGENPTGFGCLLVKKSAIPILEDSGCTGIINLIPPRNLLPINEDSSGTDLELALLEVSDQKPIEEEEAECRNLDHIESLGLTMIGSRARFLINWLTNALTKLNHPNAEKKLPLVRIYGPNVKFDRGPALAFNVYDWKGEKIEPFLVQKLADRNNISLSYAVLHHIWFPDEKERVLEKAGGGVSGNLKRQGDENVINVITIALGFLSNFEDVYKVWAFVARFLDADFVEKERWRYTALNQNTIEL